MCTALKFSFNYGRKYMTQKAVNEFIPSTCILFTFKAKFDTTFNIMI